MIGRKFGRWEVLEMVDTLPCVKKRWLCRCECGSERSVEAYALKHGLTKSCGCLRREVAVVSSTTHGLTKSSTYNTWACMKDRCTNPKNKRWSNYGGRGITFCDRWSSFSNFMADMGERPFPSAQLDRRNNDSGYSPENCRWVTQKANVRNKSNNVMIVFQNETLSLSEWAEKTGIKCGTLWHRIRHNGWTAERALTEPVRVLKNKKWITDNKKEQA